MAIQSYDVSPGDDVLAVDHNYLRADLLTNDITIAGVKTFSSAPVCSAGITLSDDSSIAATKKFSFDGGADETYIVEGATHRLDIYVGGVNFAQLSESTSDIFHVLVKLSVEDGTELYLDGGTNYYIIKSGSNINFYANGSNILSMNDASAGFDGNLTVDGNISITNGNLFYLLGTSPVNQNFKMENNGIGQVNYSVGGSGGWTERFRFAIDGTGYADVAWNTFSPNIADMGIINPNFVDYLNWALRDAKKPIKPYDGIPEDKKEADKYAKDISKISIGIAYWAEEANKKIQELETKIKLLEAR